MNIPIQQIINILITSPGNLIYHLVMAFTIMSGLQSALLNSDIQQPSIRRMILGFSILLLGQIILFVMSGLSAQGLANPRILLPPLDRSIFSLISLWLVWIWCFPNPNRTIDAIHILLNAAIILGAIFTISLWTGSSEILKFNQTWLDTAWNIASTIILFAGIGVLLVKRPDIWGIGVVVLTILLVGIVINLVFPQLDADFSGAVRLAQICAFPLLPTLARRIGTPHKAILAVPQSKLQEQASNPSSGRDGYNTRTLQAWMEVAVQRKPEEIAEAVTQAVGRTMIADLCLLVTPPDLFGQMILQSGFDLIREDIIPAASMDHQKVPTLANSIQRAKPLNISSGKDHQAELSALGEALQISKIGNLLFIPLNTDQTQMGGILLLSPYSNHVWTPDEQTFLVSHSDLISQILLHAYNSEPSAGQSDSPLLEKINELSSENQTLLQEISLLRESAETVNPAASTQIENLIALQQEAQSTIEGLLSENEILRNQLLQQNPGANPLQMEQIENELKLTLEEVVRLQNSLVQANAKIMDLQEAAGRAGQISGEERDVIASIIQELRQPLSSILGYNELLLGESVGILGALQRKFLERIKSSTERMRSLLDDLVQITSAPEVNISAPEPVDLGSIIDQSINETSGQLRSKNITLLVDIPDVLPHVYADKESLQQILTHLLQNAGTATPVEGTIELNISVKDEDTSNPLLLIEVTDYGGGIPPEDLSKVFSRKYRAENPLIQGLGDTGVGLSIVKALVEAHGGQIWVNSKPDETTTFSVLIPIQPQNSTPDLS